MRRLLLLCAAFALGACSTKLTKSSAVADVQKQLERDHTAQARVNITSMTSLMFHKTQFTPQQMSVAFQRLLKAGYTAQETSQTSYPDISGTWRGEATWQMRGYDLVLNLQMTQSRPPTAIGNRCLDGPVGNTCWAISGTPDRSGAYSFALPRPGLPSESITLRRGNPGTLVGAFSGVNPADQPYSFPILLTGPASGRNIVQDEYLYTWGVKFPHDAYNAGTGELTVGTVVVDSCEQLLLAGQSAANATLRWHASLSSLGKLIYTDDSRTKNLEMHAAFGKQPDGTWVVTSTAYQRLAF